MGRPAELLVLAVDGRNGFGRRIVLRDFFYRRQHGQVGALARKEEVEIMQSSAHRKN